MTIIKIKKLLFPNEIFCCNKLKIIVITLITINK